MFYVSILNITWFVSYERFFFLKNPSIFRSRSNEMIESQCSKRSMLRILDHKPSQRVILSASFMNIKQSVVSILIFGFVHPVMFLVKTCLSHLCFSQFSFRRFLWNYCSSAYAKAQNVTSSRKWILAGGTVPSPSLQHGLFYTSFH